MEKSTKELFEERVEIGDRAERLLAARTKAEQTQILLHFIGYSELEEVIEFLESGVRME